MISIFSSSLAIACFTVNFIKPDMIPFLKMGVSADLNESNSKEIFTDELLKKFNITREDLFKDGDIEVKVEVNVTNNMMFNVWKAEDDEVYVTDEFINPTIDSVVDQLDETFTRVAKMAAKSSIKTMVEQKLWDTLSDDKNLYQELNEHDLNSHTLSEDIDTILDDVLSICFNYLEIGVKHSRNKYRYFFKHALGFNNNLITFI